VKQPSVDCWGNAPEGAVPWRMLPAIQPTEFTGNASMSAIMLLQ